MTIDFDNLNELHREILRLRADPECTACDGNGIYYGNVEVCPCTHQSPFTQLNEKKIDALLNQCTEDHGECMTCSQIICPHGDALHFHHDGCPSCTQFEQNGELS